MIQADTVAPIRIVLFHSLGRIVVYSVNITAFICVRSTLLYLSFPGREVPIVLHSEPSGSGNDHATVKNSTLNALWILLATHSDAS